jgi:hypothetical protein
MIPKVFQRFATCLAVAILGVTAVLKITSLYSSPAAVQLALARPNLVFPFFSERKVLILASLVELSILLLLILSRNGLLRFGILAWISSSLLCYHYAISSLSIPCNCAGAWKPGSVIMYPQVSFALLILLLLCATFGLIGAAIDRRINSSHSRSTPL